MPQLFKLCVIWPEIVTPLRHAVSLVDDETTQTFAAVQMLKHFFQTENKKELLCGDMNKGQVTVGI